jgi:chromosome segregation ATPase
MESLKQANEKNPAENMETKNSLSQIQSTIESNSRRMEHVENRNSGLRDKMHFKEKREESLDKRLKTCKRNMQEVCDSMKRPAGH